jgi:putative cardiolipin synthase
VVVYDLPEKILHDFDKSEFHLAPKLAPFLDGIQDELIIFSPYFVPGKPGTAFLGELSERGVRVRILTNSLSSTNVGIVHSGYAKYRKDLLRAGVELYELNKKIGEEDRKEHKGKHKTVLHAKSFVFDRKQVFIGSLNLDPRALYHNTEIGVVLTSAEIANDMGDWFDQNIEQIAFRLELTRTKTDTKKSYGTALKTAKNVSLRLIPIPVSGNVSVSALWAFCRLSRSCKQYWMTKTTNDVSSIWRRHSSPGASVD